MAASAEGETRIVRLREALEMAELLDEGVRVPVEVYEQIIKDYEGWIETLSHRQITLYDTFAAYNKAVATLVKLRSCGMPQ